MSFSDFWNILFSLIANYLAVGWPFALAHATLLFFFLRSYRQARSEVRHLAAWKPGQSNEAYRSSRILQQFIADCSRHGERGSLIPMTDYSDRLDAHIGHSVATLSTRANLFLIVGVLGTFFALFQFAFEVRGGLPPEAIGRRLSQGLASAFPIGFIGLALAFWAHWKTDSLEGEFRQRAEDGVQQALAIRSQTLVTVESAVLQAIEPLRNLEATLSRTLQPVIESFRDQLRQTHQIMAQQVQPLVDAVDRLQQTTQQWNQAMEVFRAASGDYHRLLRESAEMQKENLSTVKRSRKIFDDLERLLQASAGTLTEASHRILAVPQVLSDRLAQTMDDLAIRVETSWQEASRRVSENLAATAASLQSSASGLSAAAGQLGELASSISQNVSAAIARQQDQLAVSLTEMNSRFARAAEEMMEKAENTWRHGADRIADGIHAVLLSDLQTMRYAAEEAREKLAEGAACLITYATEFHRTLQSLIPEMLQKAADELVPYLSRLDQATSVAYPKALENLKEAAATTERLRDGLASAVIEMERLHAALASASADVHRTAQQLSQSVHALGSNGAGLAGHIFQELKPLLEGLPDALAAKLARAGDRGEPVFFVKTVPFWRKIP